MNTKKLLGLLCWLIAFAIPARTSLLETENVENIPGLVAFVAFIALVFTGYILVDGAGSKKAQGHGH